MTEQLPPPITARLDHSQNGQGESQELVLGDDGKPLAAPLTPEQAQAGVEALDALMLLPNIHPDTPLLDAILTLRTQLPVIDKKAQALEEAKKRRGVLMRRVLNIATTTVLTGAVGFLGYSCYDANLSPIAYRTWEAAHALGTKERPSTTSINDWIVKLPDDATGFTDNPNTRPRTVKENQELIVNNQLTGIKVDDYRLFGGQTVTALEVKIANAGEDIALLPPVQPNGSTAQVVIFENTANSDEVFIAITRRPSTPPTFEIREMKRTSPAR